MKIKKILSLAIAVMMLLSMCIFANADTYSDVKSSESYYESVEALSALKILKGYNDGNFLPEGKITRAEAAVIILRLTGMGSSESLRVDTIFKDVTSSHWASGVINDAYNAGIINGMSLEYDKYGNVVSGIFSPESEVTYDQFLKMLVCALGYQKKAEASVAKGTNPFPTGYRTVANQKRITEGTSNSEGGTSRATVAKLVYNALTVNLMDQTSFGTDVEFSEIDDQSLLYTKLNVMKVDAKISKISLDPSSNRVSLTIINGGYDNIALKNNRYNTQNCLTNIEKGDVDLSGLQGLTVTALVDISSYGGEKLIAVFPKSGKNHTLAIEPSLFKDIDNTSIKYYKTADAYTLNTSSKVEAPFNIYLNLVNVATADTASQIASTVRRYAVQNGYGGVSTNDIMYRFVDTDNNSYYDSLYIDNAASFVVGKTNSTYKEIYRSTSSGVYNSSLSWNSVGTYDLSPLSLDTSDEDVSYTIKDSSGYTLDFDDIDEGDVLTVYMSEEDGYRHYDIVVSTARSIYGTIDETYTQKLKDSSTYVTYYVIDGESYRLNKDASSSKLEAGLTGEFMLTADNKIISYSLDAKARNFAAAINIARVSGAFDNGIRAQFFMQNGSIAEYNFASKYYVNGASYTVDSSNIQTLVNGLKASLPGQIIIYELNNKNEIRKLYYGSAGLKMVDEDYRLMDYTSEVSYKAASSKLGSAYISDNTSVVAIKNSSNITDKNQYSLISKYSLVDEKSYKCYIVTDSAREAEFVLLSGFVSAPSSASYPFIVTNIGKTAVDGSPRTLLRGYIENREVAYALAEDEDLTFIDMSGKVDGNAFTTHSISSTYNSYTSAKDAKDSADSAVTAALAAKTSADNELQTASTEYEAAANALAQAETEYNAAKEAYENASSSLALQQSNIESSKNALTNAESNLNNAKSEKEASDKKLSEALIAKNNADAAYLTAKQKLDNSKKVLSDAEAAQKTAGTNLITAEGIASDANKQLTKLQTEKATLLKQIETSEKAEKEASANVTTATKKLEDAKTAVNVALKDKATADATLKTITAEKDKADKALAAATQALSKLEAEKNISDDKISSAKADVEKSKLAVTTAAASLKAATDDQKKKEENYNKYLSVQLEVNEIYESAKTAYTNAAADLILLKDTAYIDKLINECTVKYEAADADIKKYNTEYINSTYILDKAKAEYAVVLDEYGKIESILKIAETEYDQQVSENSVATNNLELANTALNTAKTNLQLTSEAPSASIEELKNAYILAETKYNTAKANEQTAKEKKDDKQLVCDQCDSAYTTALAQQTNATNSFNLLSQTNNSASLSVASTININDVLQITLNANDEITSYKHLVKNYDGYVYVMEATVNDEDSATDIAAQLVAYPLRQDSVPDIIADYDTFNGIVVKTGITMEGYGIGGRVYNVGNRSIEFFNPKSTASTYLSAIDNLKDVTYNSNVLSYYIGETYSKPRVTSLDSLKSYKYVEAGSSESEIKASLNKLDDIVYIYKYDDETYLSFVIDTKSDNR